MASNSKKPKDAGLPPLSVRQVASRDLDAAVQDIDAAFERFATAQRMLFHAMMGELSDKLRHAFNVGQE